MLINRALKYGKQLAASTLREAVGKGQELRADFDSFDPDTGVFSSKPENGEGVKRRIQSSERLREVPKQIPNGVKTPEVAKSELIARMINDLSAIAENEITVESTVESIGESGELYDRAMIDAHLLFKEQGQVVQELSERLRDVEVVNLGLEDALLLCLASQLKQRSQAFSPLELHHDSDMLETFISIELSVLASKGKLEYDPTAEPVQSCEFLGTLRRYGLVDGSSTQQCIDSIAPCADLSIS